MTQSLQDIHVQVAILYQAPRVIETILHRQIIIAQMDGRFPPQHVMQITVQHVIPITTVHLEGP